MLYVANSDEHNIRAYDLDHNGDASNERVFVAEIDGVPGGMRTDEKGNLYVAAKGIAIYSPEGKLHRTIPDARDAPRTAPSARPICKTLFITARGNRLSRAAGCEGSAIDAD